ncbi:MAG: tRNA (adenosine(37)-N6)-dimethylallyltransferase MiaA [Flavobacteriales bacterium]|nr:tRNA (adenosine(37)-N6)-dimethylallyltransferase MiaA [Flavobacteriales bacterium]
MSTNPEKQLIVIVGPTAIGKTALSIKIAKHFNCEILSADSRQFYQEMAIGTAKPTSQEMEGVPHHFINHLSIQQNYTAGDFEKEAIQKLENIFQTQNKAILVGGSGLFVNAVCYGLDDIPCNPDVRDQLIQIWKTEGLQVLQTELKKVDPIYFEQVDQQNPHRVIRALETYRVSGQPYSTFRNLQKKIRPFNITWIGLNLDRAEVYKNINQRVDVMIKNGLLDEVRALESNKDLTCLKTVGYQEFYQNPQNTQKAIELVKQNTRRFAKRQLTFFKRNKEITWFTPQQIEDIISHITLK